MRIEVTKEDIDQGLKWAFVNLPKDHTFEENRRKSCLFCPVALAMKRATGGQNCVAESYRLHVGSVVYRTPEVVSDWMEWFDRGQTLDTFSFEIKDEDILSRTVKKKKRRRK